MTQLRRSCVIQDSMRLPAVRLPGLTYSLKNEIDIAPVFCSVSAFARPVRIVREVIGHLHRPIARQITVVKIPFNRLAKTRGTARRIRLPSWSEHESAAERIVRSKLRLRLLNPPSATIFFLRHDDLFD